MRKIQAFHSVIQKFESILNIDSVFNDIPQQFLMKPFKLGKISLRKLYVNYQQMVRKYEAGELESWKDEWHKNQRKIYIQFLICFCILNKLQPEKMEDQVWKHLSMIFFEKDPMFLKFQGLSIKKNTNKISWNQADDQLIRYNVKLFGQGNWNSISKNVFYSSGYKTYFSPKQIRERWLNHLSERICRGSWRVEEDLVILQHVVNENKRWCQIVKLLDSKRTEHMIKNRFKFLIKEETSKKTVKTVKELRKVIQVIKKLKRKLQRLNKNHLIRNSVTQKDITQSNHQTEKYENQQDIEELVNLGQIIDGNNIQSSPLQQVPQQMGLSLTGHNQNSETLGRIPEITCFTNCQFYVNLMPVWAQFPSNSEGWGGQNLVYVPMLGTKVGNGWQIICDNSENRGLNNIELYNRVLGQGF